MIIRTVAEAVADRPLAAVAPDASVSEPIARLDLDATPGAVIMTAEPQTVGPEASLVIAMDLMTRGGFRHLPVVDDGQVYGMLSMRRNPGHYRRLCERYEAAFTELTELDELAAMGVALYRAAPGG